MKTIKIKKEHKKHVKMMSNLETDGKIMMEHGATLYRKSSTELWEFLDKKYSLNLSKLTRYTFDLKNMEITQTN